MSDEDDVDAGAADAGRRAMADGSYSVGYKKPPKHTRFRKGVSGNPSGRPRGAKSVTEMHRSIARIAAETVGEKDGEAVTLSEAIFRKTAKSAIEGNAHAQRTAILMIKEAEETVDRERLAEIEHWTVYVEAERKRIKMQERQGAERIVSCPHPDDIVIKKVTGVMFTGPRTIREMVRADMLSEMRDAHLAQDAYDKRMGAIPRYPKSKDEVGYSFAMAVRAEAVLPRHWRLGAALYQRMQDLDNLGLRKLKAVVRDAWGLTDGPKWRGKTYG